MICTVCEIQLSKIDCKACDKARPESQPQWLAPEVTRNHDRYEVQEHVQVTVIAKK